MTMGERLRRAREEAGLSQRQVCGDQITRNQLSQLEHDRVGPSVETLRYLAGQLGRPVSYFLDETPSNLLALQEARIRADPGEALRALEGYQPDGSAYDDLAALLESILCLAASDQAAAEGRLPYARSLAARGREALTRCAFPAGDLVQGWGTGFPPGCKGVGPGPGDCAAGSAQPGSGLSGPGLGPAGGSSRPVPAPGAGSLPLGPISGGIGASALCRGSGNTGRGSSYLAAAGGLLPGVWRLPGRL